MATAVVGVGPAEGSGPTNVSGTISANTTWSLANSPYVMTGDVSVAAGVMLTVEPGVVVQANSSTRVLTVAGSLAAVGTASQPITFTSSSDSGAGQWKGVTFSAGAGVSSLKFVNARYGGNGGVSDQNGMVTVAGGTLTVEDSTFASSSVSGISISGGSTVIRRSRFESNGFVGSSKHGDGLYAIDADVTVEDSAFWSNASDGVSYSVGSGYAGPTARFTGSSMWGNKRFGVAISDTNGIAHTPLGHVEGKPGNAIYDNGTFGFSQTETWNQISAPGSSTARDWTGTYWGPVTFESCGLGNQNGHLSYSLPDPNASSLLPVTRGPAGRTVDYQGTYPNQVWCGNDYVKGNVAALTPPDLYYDPPPPTFGGLLPEQTRGCLACQLRALQNAMTLDAPGGNPLAFTSLPVSTATGSLTEAATDVRLPGPGIAFEWARGYNSQDSSAGALGPGWTHPFGAAITVVNPTTGELEYRAGGGQRSRFTKVSGGSSGAASYRGKGFDGSLKRLVDNSYELVTRDQRKFSFDASGNLTQLKPRFGPATTLAYASGKLSSITDSAGRTITLTYSTSDPALIERVTLPDGRYVQYGYTSGRLTSVRDLRGKTTTLAYDGSGRLTSILDPSSHYELQNVQYDAQGRVTSEQNGSGDAITYAYSTAAPYEIATVTTPGRGSTIYRHLQNMLMAVIDPLGHTTSYTYDGMARLATVTDPRGNTRRIDYDQYGNAIREVAPSPLGYVTERTYNATNDLLSEKDGRGNTTAYAYATSSDPAADYQVGQLKTVSDREGAVSTFKYWTSTSSPAPPSSNVGLLKSTMTARSKTTSYGYDSQGNLTTVTSPLGLKTTMGYDASGRLTSQRDPRGNVPAPPAGYLTQWTYDDGDNVLTVTDARSNTTSNDYYDNGLLWKVTRTDRNAVARVTSFTYDDANRLATTTDPRSGVETRLYWPDGQLKSVTTPAGRTTSYGYDDAGRLTSLVEPNGNATGATAADWTWTYTYDNAGNRTSAAHPDGGTSQIAYDALDRPYLWTDALSHTRSVEYDANSNVTKRTDGLGHYSTAAYDKEDRSTSETDERGKTWSRTYFATGELASTTTPLGNKTTYSLDDDGRVASMVEPRGNVSGGDPSQYTWGYQYDENSNRTRVTDPLGNYTQYVYDELDQVTRITDPRGNATDFSYDVLIRLWKVTPPAAGASGTLDTVYSYDANGGLATRTDPNGHDTTWSYDLDGLQTQRTTPVGSWNSSYDANGNPKTLETAAGSSTQTAGDGTTSYGYDRMSRQTGVDYSDSTPDVTRSYDIAGRPATMADGAGTATYTFDNADRLTDLTRSGAGAGLNGSFSYGYDDAGNITSRTYPDTTAISGAFDDDGRLSSVTSGGATTSFGYDAAGNLTSTTQPTGNGYIETRTFDRASRLTSVDNAKSGSSLSKFVWTLDATGNPTKAQTTRGGSDTYDVYDYDTRNRLTAACYGMASTATSCGGATNAITYAYDKVSNRTQEVRTGSVGNTGTIDSTYNAADQLTSTTKSGNTTNYGYDANGNQTSGGARTFSYDLADRLISTSSGGTTTSYSYDGDDRRLSSTTSGGGPDLRYSWDTLADSGLPELALERTPAGSLVRRYLDGPTGALSYTTGAGTFSYHHDPLGNVSDVTDATGAAQWQYEYEAYGAERSATNVSGTAPENRLRFNSQYLDTETVDYHLRARQYDPATGRFDGLDPIENPTTNPFDGAYVYVSGRPTVLVDPLGLCWSLKCAAHAVANYGAGVADTYTGGLSTVGLNAVGVDVDTHSKSFKAGQVTGYVTAAVTAGGAVAVAGKVAVKAGGRYLARRAERAALKKGEQALEKKGEQLVAKEGEEVVERGTAKAAERGVDTEGGHCAAGEDDAISLYKASRSGRGDQHLADGYLPQEFPEGAYFARDRVIAENFAKHYKEGVIETRIPKVVYREHFAQHERPFLDIPNTTEVVVPPEKLPLLNTFPRVRHPW